MSAKRQHFIPILHLKHFVGPTPPGQVWTYDAMTGDVWSGTPDNTGVQSHFYSVEADDGTLDTRVEDYLASVESDAAPVYEALLRDRIPSKDSQARAYFAQFLALMHVRTPTMRRMTAELIGRQVQILSYAYATNDKAFEDLNRRAERDGARHLNDEEKARLRKDFLDPSGFVMQISQERTLNVLGAADKLAPILSGMKWSIVIPAHGFFITTDNPLVREVDPKSRHPLYGDHGFMNQAAEVIFPLAPNRLLLMSWEDSALDVGTAKREYVDRVNKSLAAHSDRYLYGHIRHKRLEALAAEFKDSRLSMTTHGYGPKTFAKIELARRMGTQRDRR